MPLVSFLIAGVQKGGTTALFDYLGEHPDLQLPAAKEVHFFDDETGVDWARPDYGGYHRAFGRDEGRIMGEATPIYVYWPPSLERIARYNPAMRLILIFRDPRLRAWSHWRMERARGWETEPFGWCIRQGRARVASGDPAAPGAHRVHSYVERGFYGAQLARVYELFPREQVLLLRSEDLKRDPDGALARVCRHIDVAPFTHPLRPREVNVSALADAPSRPEPEDMTFLAELFRDDLDRFADLSGLDVKAWGA